MKKIVVTFFICFICVGANIIGADFFWALNFPFTSLGSSSSWTPNAGAPPGTNDVGIFSSASQSTIGLQQGGFDPPISPGEYRFIDSAPFTIEVYGTGGLINFPNVGVTNSGSAQQHFIVQGTGTKIIFFNNASADTASSGKVIYDMSNGGFLQFQDSATASNARLRVEDPANGSLILFFDTSTADRADIFVQGNNTGVDFFGFSTGGNATITGYQSEVGFNNAATAGNAQISMLAPGLIQFNQTANAGTFQGHAKGSRVDFNNSSDAANCTILAESNSLVRFNDTSKGSNANIHLLTGSQLTIIPNITLGSVNGDSTTTMALLAGNQVQIGTNNSDSLFEGTITGNASSNMVKVGTGTMNTTGDSPSFFGTTFVNQGSFGLNGSLGGNTFVNGPGKLFGTGTNIGDLTVNSGGTIDPGNSIGTLHILGNYVQNPLSIYLLQVSNGGSSLIDVNGTATLNGGAVQVISADGSVAIGSQYLILHSNSARIGTFTNAIAPRYLTAQLSYDALNAYLTLFTQFTPEARTHNQRNVAKQFDLITHAANDLNQDIASMIQLSPSSFRKALDQLSGEQYSYLIPVAIQSSQGLIRRLYSPVRDIAFCDCCCLVPKIWSAIEVGGSFKDGDKNAKGYRVKDYSFTLGIQKSLDCGMTAGVAVNYGYDNISFSRSGHCHMQNYQAALYGIYQSDCFYILSDLIGGNSNVKMKRPIHLGSITRHAKSSPDLFQIDAYVESGMNFTFSRTFIQPFIGFDYTYSQCNKIKEHGAQSVDLTISKQKVNTYALRPGIHFTYQCLTGSYLAADISWFHPFNSTQPKFKAKYRDFGDTFSIFKMGKINLPCARQK